MEALQMLLPNASSSRKVFVLYGLGGIGKTQLAIKFAKDHQSEFNSTLFLDGSSEESLLKSFASIHRHIIEVKTPHLPDSALLAKASQMSLEEMAQEVLQWLAQEHNNKWLLIFDNIDKEPLDEGGFDIMPYFPQSDHGSILITTRLAPLQRLGHAKKVNRMSEEEAVALLGQIMGTPLSYQQRTSPTFQQKRPRNELLETLDGLPLAISQAGQFINTLNLTVETYMELYRSSKRDVMDMLSSDVSLHDAEKSSIRTTWTTSLNLLKEKALKQGPDGQYYAAYHLLQLFAYFEPSDLNYDIIRFGIIGNNIPDWFRRTFRSKVKFFGAVKVLLDLCLIDNSISEGVYSMHRVVHDWLCTYVCWETNRELVRLAIGAISYAAPLYLTKDWFEEQQQLALHALHILPRLKDLSPNDFLVDYDKMTEEELCMVTSLLDQPVKCWKLLKYELTLMGISRLLQSRDRRPEALKFILDAQSRCLETLDDGTKNPAYLLLCYSAKGCSAKIPVDLLRLSAEFLRIGSTSWSIITLNLHALILHGMSLRPEAIKLWEESLDQSKNNTGSVFMHPTWMLFGNLVHRIRNDPERLRQMFEKFESDAKNEKHDVEGAKIFLATIERMRSDLQ